MTIHQHALSPDPEPLTPSILFPVYGATPPKYSIRTLKSAIASFDGVPPLVLQPHYHATYDQTFDAIYDDIETARATIIAGDKSRIRNLGSLPSGNEGIKISYESWKAPYGPTLAFAGVPRVRTAALLLRGDDAGRLASFTIFALRTLSPQQTGRDDGKKQETLVPNCYFRFVYVPDGDGNLEPSICADPKARAPQDFRATGAVVAWLLERDRRKRSATGSNSPRKAA